MSLVGTRPILPDELEQYELHHRARIAIKPGITGMWQVSGRSDITDFEEIVRLDSFNAGDWVHSILCSYVAFSSIVLFDMLLRSNDFEWFVVSEYCKYHIAYLM